MEKANTNYKLLFAAIIAFFAIMTLDVEALQLMSWTEILKVVAGLIATIYLVSENVRRFNRSREGSDRTH